jgi:hypothetical protein
MEHLVLIKLEIRATPQAAWSFSSPSEFEFVEEKVLIIKNFLCISGNSSSYLILALSLNYFYHYLFSPHSTFFWVTNSSLVQSLTYFSPVKMCLFFEFFFESFWHLAPSLTNKWNKIFSICSSGLHKADNFIIFWKIKANIPSSQGGGLSCAGYLTTKLPGPWVLQLSYRT